MQNLKTSRRDFLKASGGTVSALAVPMALNSSPVLASEEALTQQAYFLRGVLHKQVNRSDIIRRKHVDTFVRQFGERYGVVDYRGMYSGVVGEYRLTRLFVRSLHLASTTGAVA